MGAGSAGSSGSNDTEVSGYEKVESKEKGLTTYSEKKIKKNKITNPNKDDTDAKIELFKTKGATDIENKKLIGSTGLLKEGFKKGSVATRTMFYDDVLTSKRAKTNIGYTQEEFKNLSRTKQEEVYKGYLDNRMSGATDAYGNVSAGYSREKVVQTNKDGTKEFKDVIMKSGGGGGGDNQARTNVVTEKKVGGQTILTTEGKVAEEKAKAEEYDERKTKKRGRNRYMLTSSKGVTKVSDDYSLGKKSLLGTV